MKVLFSAYPWAFQSPGGGESMLLKTKEALEKKGVEVKLFDQWNDKLTNYDILHTFGSAKECLGLMQTAKALGVKNVLSTIYWSTLQRSLYEYGGARKKIELSLRHISKVIAPSMPSDRRRMLKCADILLPNSYAEAEQVRKLFSIKKEKMQVVYLGADEKFSKADKTEFVNKYGVENFILSIGRIEPRKNHLNLIKAIKDTGLKLVLIGNPVACYENYHRQCKKIAGDNVIFINRLDHESTLFASAYAACSVFVLQGWFETPGLVALEAGLAGANLAVTEGGSTREYFKDYAQYFNPSSPISIREAIFKALYKPNSKKISDHIMNNFLWSISADQTLEAYKKVLQ